MYQYEKGRVMKITQVLAREIFDSRGFPTIECELTLANGVHVRASVPSGASRGMHEAVELRDGGTRLMGAGVLKAIENVEHIIAPVLVGSEPDLIQMDVLIMELDGTENKSHLGANAMLAASIAVCKAQAVVEELDLYELIAHLCGYNTVALPFPLFNVINGGVHVNNNLQIQELMIMPVGVRSFRAAMELGVTVFHTLKNILKEQGKSVAVGDEGGFAPYFDSEQQALDCLMQAIELVQQESEGSIMIALDVAASQWYNPQTKLYQWHGTQMTAQELISFYEQLIEQYPIYAIEDGLAENDWDGWQQLAQSLSSKVKLVGDDIFVTNAERIRKGIELQISDTVLIKPNQVGTVTETLQAIKLCKEHGKNTMISHRSGETNDSFIADVAVGTSSGHIKAGGCSRGERMAKYNRLLRIEDGLLFAH